MTNKSIEEYTPGCFYLPNQFRIIYQNIGNKKDDTNLEKFKNPKMQFLPFPQTITNYLLSMCTSNFYQKLIQTCKYFFFKYRITIIPSVLLNDSFKDNQKLVTGYDFPVLPKLCNDQLCTKIWITKFIETCTNTNSNCISNFCPKIFKCEAHVISIIDQILSEKEFYFLVQPEFVLDLLLFNTVIKKVNGDFFPLDDIIGRTPKADSLCFSEIYITSETFSNLSKLPAENKVRSFYVKFDDRINSNFLSKFNCKLLLKYIVKNASPKSRFDIIFTGGIEITEEAVNEYQKKADECLGSWIPEAEKPEAYFEAYISR